MPFLSYGLCRGFPFILLIFNFSVNTSVNFNALKILRLNHYLQSITLIPDYRLYTEFAHIPDPENFSPSQKQLQYVFVHILVFGYTGFLIYRTLNLSPNPSPV